MPSHFASATAMHASSSNQHDAADVPPEHELELVHVFVLFRHGDRSPISRRLGTNVALDADETQFWISRLADFDAISTLNRGTRVVNAQHPLDPPASPRHGGQWPCGQLTNKGVSEMRAKGAALYKTYSAFLNPIDPIAHVYVESTNIRRTIRSAQSVLSGLFPSFFAEGAANKDGVLQIYADAHNHIAPSHSYALFGDLSALLADDLQQHAPHGLADVGRIVRSIVGVEEQRRVPWTGLREVLTCRRAHGRAFPLGLTPALFDDIQRFDAWLWHALYGKRDFCFRSFRAGVDRIAQHLNRVLEGSSPYKLSLFSGHDNSLVALIMALELDLPPLIPHYGAMLTFEVFVDRTSGAQFIKPLFDGQEVAFATHRHAALCPIAHWQAAVQKFLNHKISRSSSSNGKAAAAAL